MGGTIGETLQRGSITPFPLSSHPRRGDAARQAATSSTGATATRQAGCEAARGWLSAPVPHPRAEEHPHHLPNPSCSPKTTPKKPRGCLELGSTLPVECPPEPSVHQPRCCCFQLSKHGVCTGKTSTKTFVLRSTGSLEGADSPCAGCQGMHPGIFCWLWLSQHQQCQGDATVPAQESNWEQTGAKPNKAPGASPTSPLGSDGHQKPLRSRNAASYPDRTIVASCFSTFFQPFFVPRFIPEPRGRPAAPTCSATSPGARR